jgi:hypothetical protein
MDQNPFFRFVWRFNAVMLCLAIVAAGMVGLADIAGRFVMSPAARLPVAPKTSVGAEGRVAAFELGTFTLLRGTPFMFAYVGNPKDQLRSGTSSRAASIPPSNIVIYDTRDGSTKNLLTNDRQAVTDARPLPALSDDGRLRDVEALMLEVAHGDTDTEPPAFENSRVDVILFSPDGKRRLNVILNVRSAYRVDGPGDGKVFVFARESDGLTRAYEVDFRSFAVTPKGEVKREALAQ